MAITLSSKTKQSVEKVTGLSYDEILTLDTDELRTKIEEKIGKKLKFGMNTDKRLPRRGSVYLALNRFFDFNSKSLDKAIDSLTTK